MHARPGAVDPAIVDGPDLPGPLTPAALADALRLAESAPTSRAAAALLRERFPALRIVVVDAFDMRHERPAAAGARRRLYFAASDGHCWTLTADPAVARGLFVCDAG